MRSFVFLLTILSVLVPHLQVSGQPKASAANALEEGWDEIDERLVILITRLANTEMTLNAIEEAIDANYRKTTLKTSSPQKGIGSTTAKDQATGPLEWLDFYRTTADNFYYHSNGRGSTYFTDRILSSSGSQVESKEAETDLPPKVDSIKKSTDNEKGVAEAEVSRLKNSNKALIERRNRLETQQATLWEEILLRAIRHANIDKKTEYRFAILCDSEEHTRQLSAAASFMATAVSLADESVEDHALTLIKLKQTIGIAQQRLNDTWREIGMTKPERASDLGRFEALANRLNDISNNISESYLISVETGNEKDHPRKQTSRRTLQVSLSAYAETLLGLDEMFAALAHEWNAKPNRDQALKYVTTKDALAAGESEAHAKRKEFTGKYHVLNSKGGTIFTITLEPLGSCQTTNGAGGSGTWDVVEGNIRITWFGDWKDIIRNDESGYRKYALKPGEGWKDKPHEVARVKRAPLE